MKRLIILGLCLALVLSLAACGTKTPAAADPAPTAAATQPPVENAPTAPAHMPTEAPADYTVTDSVLENSDLCAFTITGTEYNDHLGLQIQVRCENKSDRTLMFSWSNVSICGFMYEPFWAEELAPGTQLDTTVGIDTYALEQIGIDSVDEITFTLSIQDSEAFMDAPLVQKEYTIYPTGKSADTVKFPVYEPQEEDTVIADNETVTFIVRNVDDELADYYTLNCYIANNTGKNLMVAWEDVSVNGFPINPFWTTTIAAGKQAYSEIIFYRSELEAYDIEVVQDVAFTLEVSDTDTWETEYQLAGNFKPVQ